MRAEGEEEKGDEAGAMRVGRWFLPIGSGWSERAREKETTYPHNNNTPKRDSLFFSVFSIIPFKESTFLFSLIDWNWKYPHITICTSLLIRVGIFSIFIFSLVCLFFPDWYSACL